MEMTQPIGQVGPRNRPPSLLACIACRRRHLKCNGEMPVCKRCQDTGNECNYQQSRRGYKGPRKVAKATVNGDENSPHTGLPGNLLTKTPSTASTGPWTPSNMTGLDFAAMGEAYSIGPFSESLPRPYTLPQDLYQTPETGSSAAQSLPLDDRQHIKIALDPQHNPINQAVNITSSTSIDPSEDGDETVMDIFYSNFHNAHPFVIPQRLYRAKPTLLPPVLKSVILFVASHFIPGFVQDGLRNAAENITSDRVPADGFKVQGLLLFGMSLFARCEQELALTIIDQAIDLALNLGMNSKTFAITHGMGNAIIEESWRRTWWDLYMVDGILSSLNSIHHTFRLQHIQNDVPLPCEETDYLECKAITTFRSQQDFLDRAFAAEPYNYSSEAYKIESVRLLGKVVNISSDIVSPNDEQVESLDAQLANFILSLPPEKRYTIERDGKCDEILFSAHNLIDSALISLHRPRSTLTFIQNHYPTECTRPEAIRAPISAYEVHTAKTIKAANSISQAIALRTPLSKHSPCFVCATLLSAIVHLPAYSVEMDMERASAIKERLQLTINALNSIGEVWPMGKAAKGQISQFARDVFAGQAVAAGRAQVGAHIQQIDIEAMMEDQTWLDELASMAPAGERMLIGDVVGSGSVAGGVGVGVDGGEDVQTALGNVNVNVAEGMKSNDVTGWM
ncbi:hypothetical protein JMJ35_005187 [Cladonia borealis]|uniref:Zn(2)-C6 fungal-type domain-containing protein n=1 Tax=Cladonia borealis TaxID=184061 RepID=A0AA39R1T1_9LECA|nr:hypothetical protein JMJ35_005187 [Cladonia borealis]